jgi:hydrogenase 3 maturation protease
MPFRRNHFGCGFVPPSELRGFTGASAQQLEASLRTIGIQKLAIVGVGNCLRGDDFAGSFVAKKLAGRLTDGTCRPLVLDAEDSPESVVQRVRDFDAETLVFMDTAMMESPPGTVKLIDLQKTEYPYFSTHNVPLKLLANMMCEVKRSFLLGIEPKSTEFGKNMSEEVRRSCASLVNVICRIVTEWEERSHA